MKPEAPVTKQFISVAGNPAREPAARRQEILEERGQPCPQSHIPAVGRADKSAALQKPSEMTLTLTLSCPTGEGTATDTA
jgi:hypothetical protein